MRRASLIITAITAMLATGCGTGDVVTTTTLVSTTTTPNPPTTSTTSTVATTTTIAGGPTTTAVGVAPTTTAAAAPGTTLPGNPTHIGPGEGDVLMVIGVAHDDVLNLRRGPGVDQPIVDRIPPTFAGLVARGNTRELPGSLWTEVDYSGTEGWVHLGFVGYAGPVLDWTADVVAELGEYPVAPSMTALAEEVAGVIAGTDEPRPDIVQVTEVTGDDLAEITYDVIGFADDSVGGARLHVFAEAVSGGFQLSSVEALLICSRGVSGEACV